MSLDVKTTTLAELLAASLRSPVPAAVGHAQAAIDGTVPSNAPFSVLQFTGRGLFVNLRTDFTGYTYGNDLFVSAGPIPFKYFARSVVITFAASYPSFGVVPFFSASLLSGSPAVSQRTAVRNMLQSVGARQGVSGAWCPDESGMVGVIPVLTPAPKDFPFVGFWFYPDGWQPATLTVQIAVAELVVP